MEVHNEHLNPTMHPTFYTMLLKAGLLIERSLNGFIYIVIYFAIFICIYFVL